jgi:required for meiotic nuclear division protein 1
VECLCYCIAEQLNLALLEQKLKRMSPLTWNRHWNVIEIYIPQKSQSCFLNKNGTLVSWNIKRHEIQQYIELARKNSINPIKAPIDDKFFYSIGNKTTLAPHEYFNVDCITLESDDSELKLALSYGLSQSIKLNYYEQQLERLINKYNPLIHQLSTEGKFKSGRQRINKIIGEILVTKSALNLTSNFLYQPKFFWAHPNLEHYYKIVEKYLDIPTRAQNINDQIDTLDEIFSMFNNYLENKHSHNLEIIIIALIAIEIMFYLLNWHL